MVPGERFITEPIAFIGNNGKFTPLHYAIAALPAVSPTEIFSLILQLTTRRLSEKQDTNWIS